MPRTQLTAARGPLDRSGLASGPHLLPDPGGRS
jgi:hypothetical protein